MLDDAFKLIESLLAGHERRAAGRAGRGRLCVARTAHLAWRGGRPREVCGGEAGLTQQGGRPRAPADSTVLLQIQTCSLGNLSTPSASDLTLELDHY